jgi:hypothetical protein
MQWHTGDGSVQKHQVGLVDGAGAVQHGSAAEQGSLQMSQDPIRKQRRLCGTMRRQTRQTPHNTLQPAGVMVLS